TASFWELSASGATGARSTWGGSEIAAEPGRADRTANEGVTSGSVPADTADGARSMGGATGAAGTSRTTSTAGTAISAVILTGPGSGEVIVRLQWGQGPVVGGRFLGMRIF